MANVLKLTSKRARFLQWGLVVALTAIVVLATVPGYLNGQWPWSKPLEAPYIERLQALIEEPLALPGWENSVQQVVNIGRRRWNLAEYQASSGQPNVGVSSNADASSFALLLRPQPWHSNQPEVEWVDITGAQRWRVDDLHRLQFSVPQRNDEGEATVTARFFRGIGDQRTFAVLQWYAWPTGGHPAPGKWFWADQVRQWQRQQRMPWVAVSLLLPIEPVGDIRSHSETAVAIGQTIQMSLMESVFSET